MQKNFWTRDDGAGAAFVTETTPEQFKRECARLAKLPRSTQPNPLDSCHDCGGYALHVTYRNGRAIGLCDDCY